MCLNWQAAALLAAIGGAVWIIAPGAVLAALPVLLVALCPLSMAIMAWSMRGDRAGMSAHPTARLAELEREQARLTHEIAQVRGTLVAEPTDQPTERTAGAKT